MSVLALILFDSLMDDDVSFASWVSSDLHFQALHGGVRVVDSA